MDGEPPRAEREGVPPICAAIDEALRVARRSQASLAEALHVTQQQVSKWVNGAEPRLADIGRIEHELGLARGNLLRRAGAVDDDLDLLDVVQADRTLSVEQKRTLLNVVRSVRGPAPSAPRRRRPGSR